MFKKLIALSAATVFSFAASAANHGKDVVDTAVAAGQFKTLATALQAAGLVETLKGKGPFTVFAPTDEAFAKILSNNIISNNTLTTLVAPQMASRKDGAIIIISSIGGLRASTVIGAYCVSKAADVQLARNLAAELGPSGIRVNCISPGLVKTDFAKALWEDQETKEQREEETPLRRIGDPDEIAGAAVYLAAPASRFMTGQSLVIDGGVTI
jgi:NAD(P)-dependent dehydrogenase (short-subunit alcohol dehydrogenase family)